MAKSEASNYVLPLYKTRALKHLINLAGGKKKLKELDKAKKNYDELLDADENLKVTAGN